MLHIGDSSARKSGIRQ